MLEEKMMGFKQEGKSFGEEEEKLDETDTSKEETSESSTEEAVKEEPSQKGDNTSDEDKPRPFHEEPRFKEVIEEKNKWKEKATELEDKLESLDKKVEEIGKPVDTTVPIWFSKLYGDDPDTYKEYQKAHEEEKSLDRQKWEEEQDVKKKEEEAKIKKAEEWIDNEIVAVGDDNSVDLAYKGGENSARNEFVKFMKENKIFNQEGNLDFRTGYKFYQKMKDDAKKEKDEARKKVAGMTSSDNQGGQSSKDDAVTWEQARKLSW